MQWIIRFLVGGAMVFSFAALGEILRPKGFAGLFGAAPSVALASLALTAATHGPDVAALQARSMIFGACAFLIYALACMVALARWHWRAKQTTLAFLSLWGIAALAFWASGLRS